MPRELVIESAQLVGKLMLEIKLECLERNKLTDLVNWTDEDEAIVSTIRDSIKEDKDSLKQLPHRETLYSRHIVAASILESVQSLADIELIFNKMKLYLVKDYTEHPTWTLGNHFVIPISPSNSNESSVSGMTTFRPKIFSVKHSNPIHGFKEKAGKFSAEAIARYLWLNPSTVVSEGMIQKVNEVAVYLKGQGFELMGIKADGNCFCNAFLESYKTLSRRIPILDSQEDKGSYLRSLIASQYGATLKGSTGEGVNRIQEIQTDGEWLTAFDEGDLLAKALFIPIRLVTVNQDRGGCGIIDMLTFSEKDRDQQEWSTIDESEKPKEYILIVDLGGHFIYAQPLSSEAAEKEGELLEPSYGDEESEFLTRHNESSSSSLEIEDIFNFL